MDRVGFSWVFWIMSQTRSWLNSALALASVFMKPFIGASPKRLANLMPKEVIDSADIIVGNESFTIKGHEFNYKDVKHLDVNYHEPSDVFQNLADDSAKTANDGVGGTLYFNGFPPDDFSGNKAFSLKYTFNNVESTITHINTVVANVKALGKKVYTSESDDRLFRNSLI